VTGGTLRLRDRVILVTGAGRGIGRATCLRLASEGASVICADIDEGNAAATAAAIGQAAIALRCDVTDAASAEEAIAQAVAHFGSLYGLMNNAAAPSTDATVVYLALADWEREIAVSLTGAFLMSKFAVPHMKRRRAAASCMLPRSSRAWRSPAAPPTAPPRPGW
jgi:NAD(P)-dependent dehydrogenase (short-subunit alcohol dehydrogenase family)